MKTKYYIYKELGCWYPQGPGISTSHLEIETSKLFSILGVYNEMV